MSERLSDEAVLRELEPTAEQLLERHLATAKTWYPHQIVPWGRGEDFAPDYEWSPDEAKVPEAVRSALFVNLLTEDNLPYYFDTIDRMYGKVDGAFSVWTRRWTAEEGRHAIAIRDYLAVTRSIDPVELEDGRMIQVSKGEVPQPETALNGLAYVTLQELATRISHLNTGKQLREVDEFGYKVMQRVSTDENFHFLFYRDLATAAFRIDPSGMMMAVRDEVQGFAMPGTGIPDFKKHARTIADAGIYNIPIHFEQIIKPVVLGHWDIENVTGLSDEGLQAQADVLKYVGRLEKVAARITRHALEAQGLETQSA